MPNTHLNLLNFMILLGFLNCKPYQQDEQTSDTFS